MAFETTSVFDAMELDHTQQRLAARNALALAHIRVENHLGAFLTSALTEEAFEARLASVKPEMDAYVAAACEECGHDKPEHITVSLVDNYRVNRRWQPRAAAGGYDQWAAPTRYENLMGGNPAGPMSPPVAQDPMMDPNTQQYPEPMGAQPVAGPDPGMAEHLQALQQMGPGDTSMHPAQPSPEDYYQGFGQQQYAATNPSDQVDTSDKIVACPECGGDKKTAGDEPCPRCAGKGQVASFGESSLDKLASVSAPSIRRWTPVVAAGNTDLGEPEPKMDKREQTPENVGDPDPGSTDHPNRRKDPLVPIPATNRAEEGHELTEIGEQTTEHKDLPSGGVTDHGFFDGGETKGPHTKTFPSGKHADPVTHEKQ